MDADSERMHGNMAEYHVGCGLAGIYAGTLKPKKKDEWQNKSLVTDEAVDAVRDYLFLNMKPGDKTNGYSWKLQDGRTIELVVHVHSADDDVSSEEDAENVAHWVALTDCANEGVYCSHCHKKVYKLDYSNTMKVRSKFCPNCGFKMLPKVEEL